MHIHNSRLANIGGVAMAKKKKVKKSKKKSSAATHIDRHHLLWTRIEWNCGHKRALRNHPYCIVFIDKKSVHQLIHHQVEKIPVPREASAAYVLRRLRHMRGRNIIKDNDPIEKRLIILSKLFRQDEPKTAEAILAQLDAMRELKKAP